jgi:hypothetical protein
MIPLLKALLVVYLFSYTLGITICADSGSMFREMRAPAIYEGPSCLMNTNEHLTEWQSKYLATVVSSLETLSVTFAAAFAVAVALHRLVTSSKKALYANREGPLIAYSHNYLLHALSSGRLQPKIYR